MDEAIAVLKQRGAIVIDPANIPSVVDPDPANNFNRWGQCSGGNNGRGHDEECSVVLKYGMKRDFNKWLASLGPVAPVKSLTELREWNTAHEKMGAIKYGQGQLDASDKIDLEKDKAKYDEDRAKDIAAWRAMRGITHFCVNTMGLGLASPGEHVKTLERFRADVLGPLGASTSG